MKFSVKALLMGGLACGGFGYAAGAQAQLGLTPIGSFGAGVFDESAAEIVAFDAASSRLFVVNGDLGGLDVIDISDPTMPTLTGTVAFPAPAFGGVQSVAVSNGIAALAIQNTVGTDNGFVSLIDLDNLAVQNTLTVGALPDSLAFTPDGNRIVVANEGEASDDGLINPNGTLSVIDLSGGVLSATATTLDFSAFAPSLSSNNSPLDSVRINPIAEANTGVLSDLEPEFVTIAPDGNTAFVSLQENNAIAVVDLSTPGSESITSLLALGAIDNSLPGNGLDGRDNDGVAVIENQPIFSLFQPDGIATYDVNGETFIVTANEGDNRADDDFSGVFQDNDDLDQLNVDPNFNGFTPGELAAFLDNDTGIGDLEISSIDGDTDGDGDLDQLFAFGGRSFSIFDTAGNLVFNSGDDFEQTIAAQLPDNAFNTDNDSNDAGENRSDDSGPEPEGVAIGEIDGVTYAFIGVERVGGVFVYDITDPFNAEFVEYVNPRDFSITDDTTLEDAVIAASGTITTDIGSLDLGPEGLVFISALDSPIGIPLLVVTNEVSGTTTIYSIPEPGTGLAVAASVCIGMLRRRRA
ncbi:MAG: choice-of-anchor I family protein [Planctomycetota bacterium]